MVDTELYFAVNGGKEWVKKFEEELAAQWVSFPLPKHKLDQIKKNRKKLEEQGLIQSSEEEKDIAMRMQVHVREIKIYSAAYPESCHKEVMQMLCPINPVGFRLWTDNKWAIGVRKLLKPMFKIIGFKPLTDQEINNVKPSMPLRLYNQGAQKNFVRVVPLATKKALFDQNGEENI